MNIFVDTSENIVHKKIKKGIKMNITTENTEFDSVVNNTEKYKDWAFFSLDKPMITYTLTQNKEDNSFCAYAHCDSTDVDNQLSQQDTIALMEFVGVNPGAGGIVILGSN